MIIPGRCLLWRWRGTAAPAVVGDVISAFERTRAARYRRSADAVRSVTSAALVRLVVTDWLGADRTQRLEVARNLRIDRSCATCDEQHGPPRVAGGPLLSVTHTGAGEESVVVVAATALGQVGVDAETVTDLDFGALAPTVLAAEEQGVGAPHTREEWFAVWTRKEAVVKATGDGLRTPMPEVVLGPAPSVVSYRGEPLPCVLRDLDLGPDVAGALAVLGVADVLPEMMDARRLLDE